MSKKIDYHEHDEIRNFPNTSNVASVNESTGMMPTPAQNNDEYRSYQEMASMAIPKRAPSHDPHPIPLKTKPTPENPLAPRL